MIDQPSRDFNFDRLKSVVAQQGWNRLPGRVIMVAGTNGKGSCIAALHALCRHVHLNVATFTSPHCWTVHERFKYNEHNISSEALAMAGSMTSSSSGINVPGRDRSVENHSSLC